MVKYEIKLYKIKKGLKRLIYKLKLLNYIRIHSIFHILL